MRSNALIFIVLCLLSSLVGAADDAVPLDAASAKASEQRLAVSKLELEQSRALETGNNPSLTALASRANELLAQFGTGVSLDQLNEIADSLTLELRQRGWKFHYVVLPPQKLRASSLKLRLVPVLLDDLQLIGADGLDQDYVRQQFAQVLQKPLYQPQIDQVLVHLEQGLHIPHFAYYSRGNRPDTVRLVIKFSEHERWHGQLGWDNQGSVYTGEQRLLATLGLDQLLGRGDRLQLSLMHTNGERKNLYGGLDYSLPLSQVNHQLRMSLSNNVFGLGREFSALEMQGDARVASLGLDSYWAENYSSHLWADYKASLYDSIFGPGLLVPDERVRALNAQWRWLQASERSVQQWSVGARWAERRLKGAASGHYGVLPVSYQGYWAGPARWSLNWQLRGQYAADALSSFDQISLTGPWGVRSETSGLYSADHGWLGSLSVSTPSYRQGDFQLSAASFMDAAWGEKRNASQLDLGAAGLSLQLSAWDVNARLQWAHRLWWHTEQAGAEPDDRWRLWGSISWSW